MNRLVVNSLGARLALWATPLALCALFLVSTQACTGTPEGCAADADCSDGQRCIADTGACVDCLSAADCDSGEGCCNGACITNDQFESSCGCAAAPGAGSGSTCPAARPICTTDSHRVAGDELASGTCQSPCNPQLGGTISAVDNTADLGFACTCNGSDDLGTCNVPFLRGDGWPHRGSDTCDPNNKCLCFFATQPCPGSSPDCSGSDGCIDVHEDTDNCGLANNDCSDPARSLNDASGSCVKGGCNCDQATDCTGTGSNVDSCQFVGAGTVTQCVCDDYTEAGEKAACPLQLACVPGGCQLAGTSYPTLDSLLNALNLEPMSIEPGDGGT